MNKINQPPRGAFWRMTKLAGLLLLPLAAMNAAAAANFPVGTHLIKGTLKDWQNKVLTSDAAVTIQAVATNGTVIASTKVADPTADGYNFLLQIPLSSPGPPSRASRRTIRTPTHLRASSPPPLPTKRAITTRQIAAFCHFPLF